MHTVMVKYVLNRYCHCFMSDITIQKESSALFIYTLEDGQSSHIEFFEINFLFD